MTAEIRALLDEGAARLAGVSEAPRREAEVLLGAALGRDRAWLLAHAAERVLDCDATDRYEACLTRRAQGEPVAYVLGEKEFWSLSLRIGPDVLVPRPETELLVERALAHLPPGRDCAVLDVACGSGAVALAIASERPHCHAVASDASAAAVETTRTNAMRLGFADRVETLRGDWFAPVAGRRFDVIACNPPYIALGDPRVEPGVRRFEPREALYAGPTGLEAIETVIGNAPAHLSRDGWLAIEHGDTQGDAVRGLMARAGFAEVATHRDLGGRERCTEGRADVRQAR
jgi:release factor glutamine methyltransferase